MNERKPLPSREQINAISDTSALTGLRDDLEAQIAKIEVDLEFRPGDDAWAARARGALVAHNICFGHVSRKLYLLERAKKPARAVGSPAEVVQAKANKQEAIALRIAAEADTRRAKIEKDRLAAQAKLTAILERTSWLAMFHKAACRVADSETLAKINAAVERDYAGRLKHEIQSAV